MSKIIIISRPILLLQATITYTLGVGIAHYLGRIISPATFGLGLLTTLSLLVGASLFAEYFRLPLTPLAEAETRRDREGFRIKLLQISYAALTLTAVGSLTLLMTRSINIAAGIFLIIAILSMAAYSIPPLRLAGTGYGELVLAVILGTLVPAVAFLLQFGELNRLLSIVTLPLTLLALAALLVGNFPTFATDQKLGRHTLLTRLTWQRAVPVHHLAVLTAFMLFAAAPFLGHPWALFWPVFLALPFATFQIIWLQRVATGGRTRWNFLISLGMATFGLSSYLLAITFWIR